MIPPKLDAEYALHADETASADQIFTTTHAGARSLACSAPRNLRSTPRQLDETVQLIKSFGHKSEAARADIREVTGGDSAKSA